jgi:hypothetical protein
MAAGQRRPRSRVSDARRHSLNRKVGRRCVVINLASIGNRSLEEDL